MKIALVGYGKMGKMIEGLAPEFGHEVTSRIDIGDAIDRERLNGAEVAIEFTQPHAVIENVQRLAAARVPIVVGTTGWLEQLPQVREIVEREGIGLVWSPNFSIGVNVFLRVAAEASRLLADFPEYGAHAWEIHHDQKKDAPSGTLIKLVDEMKKAGYPRPIDVASNRAGFHPGTHEIGFDSQADTITLRHTARSREGFARGALRAAQWIHNRTGCHEFSQILFQ
jgi:4-hydroxy-tetrahydrodipicolinate reductase